MNINFIEQRITKNYLIEFLEKINEGENVNKNQKIEYFFNFIFNLDENKLKKNDKNPKKNDINEINYEEIHNNNNKIIINKNKQKIITPVTDMNFKKNILENVNIIENEDLNKQN